MPEVCRFYGIVIKIFYSDHPPPHFHAEYGEHEALVTIAEADVFAGSLPKRAMNMIKEWAELHREELNQDWELARQSQPLNRIDPLL
ncbi:MAG: transcriptional regulator [Acidobacteria bacterium 13_1_20CM_3_53_8]|nr:MAG: transcriptional regulator [Acidobacteria bacterium 13_1_20CM_3_53_8]